MKSMISAVYPIPSHEGILGSPVARGIHSTSTRTAHSSGRTGYPGSEGALNSSPILPAV
jgi:hypothetical protein